MHYFEVAIADKQYQSDQPLTYSYDSKLEQRTVVTVELKKRNVTAFVSREVKKPAFALKPIKSVMSQAPLPQHCLEMAKWIEDYYVCSLGEALRQFAPTKPAIRRTERIPEGNADTPVQLDLVSPLTADQAKAIKAIKKGNSTTYLLHGDTGTGKTRVYLELAKATLESGKSVVLLTPEIALTSQLAAAAEEHLPFPAFVMHSHLSDAERKKLWISILESKKPVVVIGPRSALFTPIKQIGLIVVDEAHEPAYKQDQTPRYHTSRVASQLGHIQKAKVILGSATPLVSDYYLAQNHGSIIRMKQPAIRSEHGQVNPQIIDIKDRTQFIKNYYLSDALIDEINKVLNAKKQVMVYLNRRGTARIALCSKCGWQLNCPHCDVPMVYHGDTHQMRCHICGLSQVPPLACPQCQNPDISYRSIGTKALTDSIARLFPEARIARFDSDSKAGERVQDVYGRLRAGEVDILIGTQLLAKGFDLPKLALVGVVSAEGSLALPDFTSEERTFQLLYQVSGRVGRGHTAGKVIVQSYDPDNIVIKTALERDFESFYKYTLKQRQLFRFPPYSYLAQFICKRATKDGAEGAAKKLRKLFIGQNKKAEIIGPAPSFYEKRGGQYYWQLVVKSKNRKDLVALAKIVPSNWSIDLDPINLL